MPLSSALLFFALFMNGVEYAVSVADHDDDVTLVAT
jgi:hypothetical protein